jgi:hypothetical protein
MKPEPTQDTPLRQRAHHQKIDATKYNRCGHRHPTQTVQADRETRRRVTMERRPHEARDGVFSPDNNRLVMALREKT